MKRLWPVLFLALLPIMPLWRCVFLGEAIGPFDQIRQMAPWNGPKPHQPWDVLQADGVLQFYPWRDMVFKAWGHGQLPLWNNYELAGTPLLANSQSAGFYPPHVLMGVLHVPTPAAMLLLAWLHLFWAGLGAYLLARLYGASKIGGAVAGATFELSAFMLAWTALPSVITTVSWIPWLLVGIYGVYRFNPLLAALSRGPVTTADDPMQEVAEFMAQKRGDNRRFLGFTLLIAFSTGMLLLAGHLQFAAYGLMGAFVFAACLAIGGAVEYHRLRDRIQVVTFRIDPSGRADKAGEGMPFVFLPWLGSSFRTILALALGFVLAAPQLLPVLNYSRFSHRRAPPTEAGFAAYTAGAIKPFELANLVDAYTLGSPRTPVSLGEHTIGAYWPALEKPGANLAESAVTIGPFAVGLLCLLPWRRKKYWTLAAIGVLALLLALGTPLNWPLYNLVPGWASTGSPGRIIALFVLTASVLCGLAIGEEAQPAGGAQRFVALLAPLVLSAICLVSVQAGAGDRTAQMASDAATAAMTPTLLGALIAMAGVSVLIFPAAAKYRPGLIALPVILAWLCYGGNIVPSGDPIPIEPAHGFERIAFVNKDWSLLVAAPALAPPNTAYLLGEHEIGGYDSLLHRQTKALLDDIDGHDSATPANGNMLFVAPDADSMKLRNAGVSEVDSRAPLPQFSDAAKEDGLFRYRSGKVRAEFGTPNGGLALEEIGAGRAVCTGGEASVVSESPSQITVSATGPGRLTLRDRNMPGWMAKVDGSHVPIEGDLWREVEVPAGKHLVQFDYVPPGMMPGLFLGIPGWLLLIILAAVRRSGFPTKRGRVRALHTRLEP
ncbi:MAG TPA: hypothetical protein VMI31_14990 [Fimbriimonadaceae bacterium]|nr:hypothetical protein [Fimbriimonadaceae bacterium]